MKRLTSRERLRDVTWNSRQRYVQTRKAHKSKKRRFVRYVKVRSTRRVTLYAPEKIYLNGDVNRANLQNFLWNIEYKLQNNATSVVINFDKTKTLMPCGTLFLWARLNILSDRYPNRITCTYPVDDVVGQQFQHMGLLEKLGLTKKYEITAENVKCWQCVEGNEADGSKFENLLLSYESDLDQPMRMGLFESMSEAITNTAQHAYDAMPKEKALNRWWLFATKINNDITVAIYDAGIGIAGSLRVKPELVDIIRRTVRDTRGADVRLIRAAIGSRRSKTELPYRGKGLPEMLNFVKSTNIGGMLIHSNKGTFMYSAADDKEHTSKHRYDLDGTLIQWTIPLTDEV